MVNGLEDSALLPLAPFLPSYSPLCLPHLLFFFFFFWYNNTGTKDVRVLGRREPPVAVVLNYKVHIHTPNKVSLSGPSSLSGVYVCPCVNMCASNLFLVCLYLQLCVKSYVNVCIHYCFSNKLSQF